MSIPGYGGKLLFVDLETGITEEKKLNEFWAEEYLGGWGINYRIAFDLIQPGTDPFSPSNPIILGVGPLVGTLYPGANKLVATCKMPLTASKDGKHFVATSTAGSDRFALMLKNTGYDHVVIRGHSKRPVYIKIDNDSVEICDAGDLWGGKNVYETTDILRNRHPGYGVMTIGKAGENKVRFAMAFVDKSWHLGKSGFGAIMGSKNLKAIIVKGSNGLTSAKPDFLMKVINDVRERIETIPIAQSIRKIGFHASWDLIWVHNLYQSEEWTKEEWSKYYGIPSLLKMLKRLKACSACSIGCKAELLVKTGKFKGQKLDATHFTTVAVVGSRLELKDPGAALKFCDLCNSYGMCATTAMAMVDWVTRLYKDKMLAKKEVANSDLSRNIDSYISLIDKIAHREGIGNIIADGWFALSEFVGKDATKDYHMSHGIAKGQESIYPSRTSKLDPMRITMLMTNPRGGHSPQGHSATTAPLRPLKSIKKDAANTGMTEEDMRKTFSEDNFNHAHLTRHIEDAYGVYNAMGVCTVYATMGLTNLKVLSEAYSALTGIQTTPQDLKKKGERIMNLYKILNVREGFTRKDDSPPEAIFTPMKTAEGEEALTDYYRKKVYSREDCERLLDEYYESRGWDVETGIPTEEKLKQLGLDEFSRSTDI